MAFPQRFDLPDSAGPSVKDVDQRWNHFQARRRGAESTWPVRALTRVVGTLPVLEALARSLRPASAPERQSASPLGPFPRNYQPPALAAPTTTFTDVLCLVVNEEALPATVLDSLNATVEATSARWIFLLDPSVSAKDRDVALEHLRRAAREDADVVFADEVGPHPERPLLKPSGVGPHSLLSYNGIGRPALLRVEAVRRVGGFRPEADICFEHDLYLRLMEAGGRFQHVARVLPAGRPASHFSGVVVDPTVAVVTAALQRRGGGSVEPGTIPGLVHWRPALASQPSVDIIIPTRDRSDLLEACITSIETRTSYPNYRITILDNDSVEERTRQFFAETKHRVLPAPGPFNYAKIMNAGVLASDADFVVALNNDTLVTSDDWLTQLVELAALPEVGIVGARLVDAQGHVEHEGFAIAPFPQHLRSDENYLAKDWYIESLRDVSAVTGAVHVLPRALWLELGGMDEDLRVTMNDVDLCLRAQAAGRYVLYTPYVELIHAASSSRGSLDPADDRRRFMQRWDILGSFKDPYFPESLEVLGPNVFYRA